MEKRRLLFVFLLLILAVPVYSHGADGEEKHNGEIVLDQHFKDNSVTYVFFGSAVVLVVILFSIFHKKKSNGLKWFLFLIILLTAIFVTFYVAWSTIYLNVISETGGPVHWHADFEIWNCGDKVDLIAPRGLSNRVGSAVFHEHGDNRIHVEGVLVKKEQARLSSFFDVVGGSLTEESLVVPVDGGFVNVKNGDDCNGREGKLQVFLHKVINANPYMKTGFVYKQTKLEDFEDYILSPYPNIPPGDCLIVEFGEEKNKTEHICGSYEFAIERGELSGS